MHVYTTRVGVCDIFGYRPTTRRRDNRDFIQYHTGVHV